MSTINIDDMLVFPSEGVTFAELPDPRELDDECLDTSQLATLVIGTNEAIWDDENAEAERRYAAWESRINNEFERRFADRDPPTLAIVGGQGAR